MTSSSPSSRRVAPAVRALVSFTILLVVLAGCATSDTGMSRLRGEAAGTTRFFVNLRSKPHLEAARAISDFGARGQFVVNELKRNAAASQGTVISFLEQRGVKYEAYWIANMILVEGDDETRRSLAELPDVESIESDVTITLNDPEPPAASSSRPLPDATGLVIEPNVTRVKAPEVWKLGYTGTGVVVGVIDSGFAPHPALNGKFQGSWKDFSGKACSKPCDGNGHGTHVTGTIVGGDATNGIGVAPGAKFISCKALDDGGSGSSSNVVNCLQWMLGLAQGTNSNARPQIINMSLGGGFTETLASPINNLLKAGTLTVAAAGNDGTCGKLGSPAAYPEALTVAALTADARNTVATYSSGGPPPYVGVNKPDIAAQGSLVRSAWMQNEYKTISGTSMAAPAVSGVAVLVLSAAPSFMGRPAALKELLERTANRDVVGGAHKVCTEGNLFGDGLVDANAAVGLALKPPVRLGGLPAD